MERNRRTRFERNQIFEEFVENKNDAEEYDEDYKYNENEPDENKKTLIKNIIFIVLAILLILCIFFLYKKYLNNKENKVNTNETAKNVVLEKKRKLKDKHFGFNVEGKIYIDKINLEEFFVEEDVNAIDSSISILSKDGTVGGKGNLTLLGHNKKEFFENLDKLKDGDKITIENIYGDKTEYKVKSKREIDQTDLSGLVSDNTKKELTLITCTADETKRLEIKAEAK